MVTSVRNAVVLAAAMTLRALLRRRVAVVLLVALPLAFYLARRDSVGQSARSLLFGVSWAISTVALFAAIDAQELEPRLGLAGWPRRQLISGRLVGLLALGGALAALFFVLVAFDGSVGDLPVLGLDFVVTTVVAVAIGSALGTVIRREFEGALVIFFLAGLQAVVNPYDTIAKFLPFWSSRELGTVAVDGPATASVANGLLHAAAVVIVCIAASTVAQRALGPALTATQADRE
jgi:hypothetical protein